MQKNSVYATETSKTNGQFVKDLAAVVRRNGFIVHNESTMEMSHTFGSHGAEVAEDFDLHMIQICKPDKAAKSLSLNPERAVLMPKFIMTFSKNGSTQIRFLHYSQDNIRSLVDDEQFQASLAETYAKIIAMIDEAK
ncbi:MAG: hypothetical protein AMJ60_00335 [Desulfobacterales bacterium SG8_35]|nr:MAG: hypothetical protein AMJ60_00335 [Desulfobacterales bacterium SG8_35]